MSAQRSLPLTPRAAEVLKRGKKEAEARARRATRVRVSGRWQFRTQSSPSAPSREGDPRTRSWRHFEFYCWRHTFGTRAAQSGMDRLTLARLMGHSSPAWPPRYYIHVTETHVAAGFGKFVEYQTRNVAEGLASAFPEASDAVQ